MESPPHSKESPRRSSAGGMIVRLLLPIALLAAGWIGFSKLSVKPEVAKEEEREARAIKTRVANLEVVDFQTVITTQGTVRSHEEVPLSSQVAGEILVELEPADFEAAVVAAEAEEVRASVALAQEEIRAEQARLNWEKLGKQGDPSDLVKRLPQLREAKTNLNAAT